jgi:hypothetical protein
MVKRVVGLWVEVHFHGSTATISATSPRRSITSAAIAGVTLSVRWMRTSLHAEATPGGRLGSIVIGVNSVLGVNSARVQVPESQAVALLGLEQFEMLYQP